MLDSFFCLPLWSAV